MSGEGRAFRRTIIGLVSLMLSGISLTLYARTLPVFTVPFDVATDAFARWCTPELGVNDAAGERYLALFGYRYALANAGVSIALAASTAIALAVGLWVGRDAHSHALWLRTPAAPWTFIAIGVGTMGLTLAGVANGLDTDLRRQLFPICADTIAIPLMGLMMSALILTPILAAIGWIVTRGFGKLPISLFHWDCHRPGRSWTITAIFVALTFIGVGIFVASITSSDLVGPAAVITVYLMAATRAALLAPSADKPALAV